MPPPVHTAVCVSERGRERERVCVCVCEREMERLAERVRVCLLKFVARVCEYEEENSGIF
jgi:hypothetical protein